MDSSASCDPAAGKIQACYAVVNQHETVKVKPLPAAFSAKAANWPMGGLLTSIQTVDMYLG